jgi:hypothetical protein
MAEQQRIIRHALLPAAHEFTSSDIQETVIWSPNAGRNSEKTPYK